MTGITRSAAARIIAGHFHSSAVHVGGTYDTYTVEDNTGRKWKVVSDASIKCQSRGERTASRLYAVEMVTPICKYEDIETIQQLVRELRRGGARVNDSCGIHIHVDASRHDPKTLRNIVNIMASKEDLLYKALNVQIDRACYCQKADLRFLERTVKLLLWSVGGWRVCLCGCDELADELIPYLLDMGYTHVELMPITEYPYDPSWGYQVTGYYAPTARYGSPQQFMTFVDKCHRAGIGVLLDWVPAHFPKDENGLYEFDGTCCYELSDPMMNEHPDWSTRIFDFGKGEVQSFLISNAVYWLEQYHVDGLRVDAVASMLYLDYGRRDFRPNKFGGRENLEAIAFLRKLNRAVFSVRRNAITAAEESTAFPMVTKPDYDGGLGFLFKWNMGWMNDMLQYMSLDPLWRKGSHNDLTFSMTYAYSENFILPLSHDEVVHGKGSLINKMPGEYDAKFQNLRAFYGFMMAHPGKKLSFMGNEFAQFIEWRHYEQLEWMLLDYDRHRQMHDWVRDLNHFYLDHSCMWNNDSDWNGFRWISADDNANSVVAFRRIDRRGRELICICNFCPVLREHYRLGLPKPGQYEPVLSSDDLKYGGSGTELLTVTAEREPMHGLQYSGEFTLAPLSAMFYQRKTTPRAKRKG